jgi:2-oxoglutarate dehydrogenase E2 component (dihydrolipoamide succinyltransferase)
MVLEIKIPGVGESVQEAILAQWYRQDGDMVHKDEPLFVIETDKVTLEIEAEADGVLKILVQEGETVAIGAVVGTIDTDAAIPESEEPVVKVKEEETVPEEALPPLQPETEEVPEETAIPSVQKILAPSVRRLVAEKNLNAKEIPGTGPGGRITKGDVLLYLEKTPADVGAKLQLPPSVPTPDTRWPGEAQTRREPMSPIRQRIADRLLAAKQNTAMLTTFNEIDMQNVISIRAQFKEAFHEKHGVSLGFMSFFIKATLVALGEFPKINASIDGKDIVYHDHYHIGIAIGAERGLVVPVIQYAEKLGFAGLEQAIVDFVEKIKGNRLELADLEGGTFTITNGGVYGSLLSTPILNIPQSGILGMHKIEQRPVVINDEVVIRPMMYVALSYDHRLVDGRQAVTFLKRIKECIENPERIMMEI